MKFHSFQSEFHSFESKFHSFESEIHSKIRVKISKIHSFWSDFFTLFTEWAYRHSSKSEFV